MSELLQDLQREEKIGQLATAATRNVEQTRELASATSDRDPRVTLRLWLDDSARRLLGKREGSKLSDLHPLTLCCLSSASFLLDEPLGEAYWRKALEQFFRLERTCVRLRSTNPLVQRARQELGRTFFAALQSYLDRRPEDGDADREALRLVLAYGGGFLLANARDSLEEEPLGLRGRSRPPECSWFGDAVRFIQGQAQD